MKTLIIILVFISGCQKQQTHKEMYQQYRFGTEDKNSSWSIVGDVVKTENWNLPRKATLIALSSRLDFIEKKLGITIDPNDFSGE